MLIGLFILLVIISCYFLVIAWGSQEFRSRIFIAIVLCGILVWTVLGFIFFLLVTVPAGLREKLTRAKN